MKYRDFQELCKHEWETRRGDVGTLWLTEKSYRELQGDALRAGQGDEMRLKVDNPSVQGNFSFKTLVNPMTRTIVKLRLARDTDVADVWYSARYFETRFLNPEEAREMGIQT